MAQSGYRQKKFAAKLPRIPLSGSLDLTYRCNNNCRHCWLRIPADADEKKNELSASEIIGLIDEARNMGCQRWSISGGEPMLRPDFFEIFDYITAKSVSYSLNTNGTLVTPKIACLLTRRGNKMVALYGATAKVHDHITRHAGSFEATIQGCTYLREAGAGFIVQLIPMQDNFHQFDAMVTLARSLSRQYRIGAPWLYFSASGCCQQNAEIARQRLDPRDVVNLDQPEPSFEAWLAEKQGENCLSAAVDVQLLARCIEGRREFHIDPYGGMTFCSLIKDPALRYDLRTGNFREGWESFIPSLADQVRGGQEYLENCGRCELRYDCCWCDVYGYLEHRRHGAKVEYLCQVAQATRSFKENWQGHHRRCYEIAGITLQVEADIPITDGTFADKFKQFEVNCPGRGMVLVHHHFSLPDLSRQDLGQEVYRQAPWRIFRKDRAWIYLCLPPPIEESNPVLVAAVSDDHTRIRIYHNGEKIFRSGGHTSLTLLPTDQILLARVMADHEGCFLHSSGVILNGQGLLFVGHSEAGKSTLVKMLEGSAKILCDDRNIVRRWPDGFKLHGTWSHGEIPLVSSDSAPLAAVLFLKKSDINRITALKSPREIIGRLLACLIKPLTTADWYEKTMALFESMVRELQFYLMEFDLDGGIIPELKALVGDY
jgi:MoaA/NifB/PqqE/SkfB family radical SAM enzyme